LTLDGEYPDQQWLVTGRDKRMRTFDVIDAIGVDSTCTDVRERLAVKYEEVSYTKSHTVLRLDWCLNSGCHYCTVTVPNTINQQLDVLPF